MHSVVIAENLTKRFGATTAVKGVSLAVSRGKITALLGGNGAGKSTLTRILSLAERQMVEISRAVLDPRLRLLILDEPTSSLGARRAHQLLAYLRERTESGLSVIFIGHRLGEILDLAQEFLVMRDGCLVWRGPRQETTEEDLIKWLSAAEKKTENRASQADQTCSVSPNKAPVRVKISAPFLSASIPEKLELRGGEIVGLAGLEGSGQVNLLRALFRGGQGRGKGVRRTGTVSYVTGDRQKEGVFPLWSTLLAMTVARQMGRRPWSLVSEREERDWSVPWTKRFTFTEAALEKQITDLSGGNQQKALFTRALLTDTETLLLDDPTRGVDVGVKAEFYQTLGDRCGRKVSRLAQFGRCGVPELFTSAGFSRGRVTKEISGMKAS